MKNKLEKINSQVTAWMLKNADAPSSQVWLGAISFLEASILPLPPSTFMLGMVALGEKKRWIYLATLTTVTSVAGGVFGYLIGSVLFDSIGQWIVARYGLVGEITHIGTLFQGNAFLAVFIGAFTPIPYKAFTIGGGFFSLNIFVFIVSSLLGRGLRFYVLAFLAKVYGEQVAKSIFKYFAVTTLLALGALLVLAVWQSF